MLEPANGLRMQYRATTGAIAVQQAYVAGKVAPYWLRLTRTGNSFTGYSFTDGLSWTLLAL